jgi:hypothetical protein
MLISPSAFRFASLYDPICGGMRIDVPSARASIGIVGKA